MSIILLDIGNVLVSVDFTAFCRGALPSGSVDGQALCDKYCQGELKSRFDRGMIAPFDYLAMIEGDRLIQNSKTSDIRAKWQNIFTPVQGADRGVELLEKEHRIWIMSDTDPLHFTFLLNTVPLLRGRERYYLSYEHGFLKSSQEAFMHVLSDSGLPAEEFLLIDDRHENCIAASETGIRSIQFTSWKETLGKV